MEGTVRPPSASRPAADLIQLRPVPQRMQAAVLAAPGRFELQEVDLPEPGPGQVRIRLQGCGVCASNLPAFEGREWFTYPLAPGDLGHEGWGLVDALGEGAEGLAVGDRVAALSFKAYAEYDIADSSAVVRLPRALWDQPFPGEALGCAMNIFRRAQIEPGQTVAIIGVGFLGGALTQLASRAGARVIAIARSPSALALAKRMGAADLVRMHDHWEVIEQVKQLTGGDFCQRVIECTGKQWPLDLAGELTGYGGRMVVAGYHQDGARQVNMQLWNWRGFDVINAHERDPAVNVRGLQEAVEAVASGRLDPTPLLTHRYTLAELNEALTACATRPDGFTKALILINGGGSYGN